MNSIAKDEPNLPHIPQEIIIEIISRLPLKSIARFTCVSKQWYSHKKSVQPKSGRQKCVVLSFLTPESLSSLHSIDGQTGSVERVDKPWSQNQFVESVAEPYPYDAFYLPIQICGSCNGLLLLRIHSDLFLWNPLTRYFKKLLAYKRLSLPGYNIVSGLCYDSSAEEYKPVMGLSHESPDYGGVFIVVGSSRSKTWTRVRFPPNVGKMNSGPVLNGHIHWFSDAPWFHPRHQIFRFDPQKNEFIKVPMPLPKEEDGDSIHGLGVLDGCLCMARFENPNNYNAGGNVEVLVMKEYGIKESWKTMFIISNLKEFNVSNKLVPLCYTKNGELLLEIGFYNGSGSQIRAYNPKYSSYPDDIHIPINCDHTDVVMYEESLVEPTDYNWEEEELRGEVRYVESFLSGTLLEVKMVTRTGRWEYSTLKEGEEYEDSD